MPWVGRDTPRLSPAPGPAEDKTSLKARAKLGPWRRNEHHTPHSFLLHVYLSISFSFVPKSLQVRILFLKKTQPMQPTALKEKEWSANSSASSAPEWVHMLQVMLWPDQGEFKPKIPQQQNFNPCEEPFLALAAMSYFQIGFYRHWMLVLSLVESNDGGVHQSGGYLAEITFFPPIF